MNNSTTKKKNGNLKLLYLLPYTVVLGTSFMSNRFFSDPICFLKEKNEKMK